MGTYEVVNLHLYVLFVLLNNFVMCVYCISDFSEPWVGVGWGGVQFTSHAAQHPC